MNETRIIEALPSVQRLARTLARTFRADREELVSVGNEAVIRADIDYDHARGVDFGAYVWMRVKYAMLEHVRREAIRRGRRPLSLDAPAAHGNDHVLKDTIHDPRTEFVHDVRALLRLVAGLPPREREVVTRDARGETQNEIARALGITPGRAWQLNAQAVFRLRTAA